MNETKQLFISLGWDETYIHANIKRNKVNNILYIKNKVESWYPVFPQNTDMDMSDIFRHAGLKEDTIEKIITVITPLYNTCYSTFHLYDIGMTWLFGNQEYDIQFSSHKNFIKGLKLACIRK